MTLSISGGYLFTASGFNTGNKGTITQTGGYLHSGGISHVDTGGTYNLMAGIFNTGENPFVFGGVVNQTGGQINPGVGMDGLILMSGGVYNLSGGTLNGGGYGADHIYAGAVFNQNGGLWISGLDWGYGVYVEGTYNLVSGAAWHDKSMVKQSGTINQSGGTYTANAICVEGTFNMSGGAIQLQKDFYNDMSPEFVSKTFVNHGTTILSGPGTRTIDGNVINNGTFKVTNTTAVYTGSFTNNGAYVSDPALQYFNDLIIGENGYLVGQNLDQFLVSGDFINHSTMNELWNTSHSRLGFLDGTDNIHDLYLTGNDYGTAMSGYANNFSWGVLDVTGDHLSLYDGNSLITGVRCT